MRAGVNLASVTNAPSVGYVEGCEHGPGDDGALTRDLAYHPSG
jgi:hypothetical protein